MLARQRRQSELQPTHARVWKQFNQIAEANDGDIRHRQSRMGEGFIIFLLIKIETRLLH